MRPLFCLFVSLSATVLGSCSLTLWNYSNIVSNHYALVYGVTKYVAALPAGETPNLNFPGSDASSVFAMLKSEGYEVKGKWIDNAGNEYVDGNAAGSLSSDTNLVNAPTKSNLVADLDAMASQVGPNDVFLFYFSGHGTQDTSSSPPVEYFIPEGGVIWSGGQAYMDESLSVSNFEFAAMLAPISTNRKVVILDSCNSGGFIGNSLEADSIPAASFGSPGGLSFQVLAQALQNYLSFPTATAGLSPYGGAMVLSAAGRDETCSEDLPGGPFLHGIMTYFLLQAPQSGDLNHDGKVTVAEVFSLVKAGIDTEFNPENPEAAFEPRISGGPIDFVLW